MNRLEDKTAIVTGGTRGIGQAIARAFVAEGARVWVTGRRDSAVVDVDDGVSYCQADSAVSTDVAAAITAAAGAGGAIDILVNNAGVELEKSIEETTEEDWDWLMGTNLKGVFLYTKAAIPVMRAHGGGTIINLASISGFVADPGLAAYNTSKAGVLGLTRSTAVDHGKDGIRCNAICPGWIDTQMLEQTFSQASDPEKARKHIEQLHPLGRLGMVQDIAKTAVWLACDESSYLTGQSFTIDGGLTAGSPANPHHF